jgi:hypothetical protein
MILRFVVSSRSITELDGCSDKVGVVVEEYVASLVGVEVRETATVGVCKAKVELGDMLVALENGALLL